MLASLFLWFCVLPNKIACFAMDCLIWGIILGWYAFDCAWLLFELVASWVVLVFVRCLLLVLFRFGVWWFAISVYCGFLYCVLFGSLCGFVLWACFCALLFGVTLRYVFFGFGCFCVGVCIAETFQVFWFARLGLSLLFYGFALGLWWLSILVVCCDFRVLRLLIFELV